MSLRTGSMQKSSEMFRVPRLKIGAIYDSDTG
jgi:hypothetical protein